MMGPPSGILLVAQLEGVIIEVTQDAYDPTQCNVTLSACTDDLVRYVHERLDVDSLVNLAFPAALPRVAQSIDILLTELLCTGLVYRHHDKRKWELIKKAAQNDR